MITKKFIASITLLAMLTGWIPIARAEDVDLDGEDDGFTELKEGEKAPTDGFFFDHQSLVNLVTKQENKLNNLNIEKNADLDRLALNLNAEIKKKETEIEINKEMYDGILKVKQERIDQLSRQQLWGDIKLVAGFALGFVSAVVLLDIAVKAIK